MEINVMKTKLFITFSFLLIFAQVPNQEIKTAAKKAVKTDSIPIKQIIKDPAIEAMKFVINELERKNESNEREIEKTKATYENFKKSSHRVLAESEKKQNSLKSEIDFNQKIIDSLKLELAEKDAIIVEQVYASIKVDSVQEEKKDSMCVRWGWLTKEENKTPENCKRWKQLNDEE